MDTIRASIGRYRIVLVLNFFATLTFVSIALTSGSPAGFGVTPYVTCGSNPADFPMVSASRQGLIGLTYFAEFLAFLALIITVLAWLKWREGIRSLEQFSGEFGTEHVLAVREARRYYSYTIWVWVGFIILSIAVVAVGVAAITSTAVKGLQLNGTFQCTPALVDSINAELRNLVTVAAVGSAVYSILLYWFATRSLESSIRSICAPVVRRRIENARWLILAGATLTFVAIGQAYAVLLSVFTLASVSVLLVGYWGMARAYAEWLSPVPELRASR